VEICSDGSGCDLCYHTNNLVASYRLWHKMIAMNKPNYLVCEIQKRLIDFIYFGTGQRLLCFFCHVNEGGHGLMDIQSRIKIFRIQAVRRLLYSGESMGTDTTCALLQKSGHFYSKYDKQLFLIQQSSDRSQGTKSEELKIFNGKIVMYQSIRFENWQKLKKSRRDVLKSVRFMKIILNRILPYLFTFCIETVSGS